jgi:hypothetical protein
MRVKPETEQQEKMDANLEKMEPNPGEKKAVVERQEIPNEEVAIHTPEVMPKRETGLPRSDEGQSKEDGAN